MENKNSIIAHWKRDFKKFSKVTLEGVHQDVSFIQIELSEHETECSTLFWIPKSKGLNKECAFLVLLERSFFEGESWDDFNTLKKADMKILMKRFEEFYSGSFYEECRVEDLDAGFDKFVFETLQLKNSVSVIDSKGQIAKDVYFKLNPLLNERIITCHRSIFKGLESEYYLEMETCFVLLNWHTSG